MFFNELKVGMSINIAPVTIEKQKMLEIYANILINKEKA